MPGCQLTESGECQRRGIFVGTAFKLKCDRDDRGGENPFPDVCRWAGHYAAYYGLEVIDTQDQDGLITFREPGTPIEAQFEQGAWKGSPLPRPENYAPANEQLPHHLNRKSFENALANLANGAAERMEHVNEWWDGTVAPGVEYFLTEGLSNAVISILRATSTEPSATETAESSVAAPAQEVSIPDPRLPLKLPSYLVWSEGVMAQRVFANKLTKMASAFTAEQLEVSALVLRPSKYAPIADSPVLDNRLVALESLAIKDGDVESPESKVSVAINEPGEGVPRQVIMIEDLAVLYHPEIHRATREYVLNLLRNQNDPNCIHGNLSVLAFVDSTSRWLTADARAEIASLFPTEDRQVKV